MPSTNKPRLYTGFPGIAAEMAVCLPKPGVPPCRNPGTFCHGSTNAKMPEKWSVPGPYLGVFLALQLWLLVSLLLVCSPKSTRSLLRRWGPYTNAPLKPIWPPEWISAPFILHGTIILLGTLWWILMGRLQPGQVEATSCPLDVTFTPCSDHFNLPC